jgi:hypothetical protein
MHITYKELAAIAWSMRKFRNHLQLQEFIVLTDHKALIDILAGRGSRDIPNHIQRAAQYCQQFKFKTIHIEGKSNILADSISRTEYTMPQQAMNFDLDLDRIQPANPAKATGTNEHVQTQTDDRQIDYTNQGNQTPMDMPALSNITADTMSRNNNLQQENKNLRMSNSRKNQQILTLISQIAIPKINAIMNEQHEDPSNQSDASEAIAEIPPSKKVADSEIIDKLKHIQQTCPDMIDVHQDAMSAENLYLAQRNDSKIMQYINYMERSIFPSKEKRLQNSIETAAEHLVLHAPQGEQKLLYRLHWKTRNSPPDVQLVLPKIYWEYALKKYHNEDSHIT